MKRQSNNFLKSITNKYSKRKKILIYSRRNLKNAYSCILYLKNALERDFDVTLWSNTLVEDFSEIYRSNTYSFRNKWYGNLKGVKVLLSKIQCFFDTFHGEKAVMIHDLDFFIPVCFAKKINPKLKVIHYNTEIHGDDVPYPRYITNFYNKHANFPEIIIDCLKERADYRKKTFGIKKQINVINNTLPLGSLKYDDIDESLISFPENLPIVIYAGGCNKNRGLDVVFESLNKLKHTCNFLIFLYGNKDEIDDIIQKCKEYGVEDTCHISSAVKKTCLFHYMEYCDIGLNYYLPEISPNCKFASPSKFYEYMASGLKIISTDNVGINRIIINEKIGTCIRKGESLSSAIIRLINDTSIKNKKDIKQVFKEKYCFEIDSEITIQDIKKCLVL